MDLDVRKEVLETVKTSFNSIYKSYNTIDKESYTAFRDRSDASLRDLICNITDISGDIDLLQNHLENIQDDYLEQLDFHSRHAKRYMEAISNALNSGSANSINDNHEHLGRLFMHFSLARMSVQDLLVNIPELVKSEDVKEQRRVAAQMLRNAQKAMADIGDTAKLKDVALDLHDSLKSMHDEGSNSAEAIASSLSKAEELLSSISEANAEAESLQSDIKKVDDYAAKTEEFIKKTKQSIIGLENEAKERAKEIEGLLPGATAASIAAGYMDKSRRKSWAMWLWGAIFVFSLVAMSILGYMVFMQVESEHTLVEYLYYFLKRAWVFAPLVWLGWFSAVQLGDATRVKEQYDHKVTIALAYTGFRKDLSGSSQAEKKALETLTNNMLEILAFDPLKVYGKSSGDIHPFVKNGQKKGLKTSEIAMPDADGDA